MAVLYVAGVFNADTVLPHYAAAFPGWAAAQVERRNPSGRQSRLLAPHACRIGTNIPPSLQRRKAVGWGSMPGGCSCSWPAGVHPSPWISTFPFAARARMVDQRRQFISHTIHSHFATLLRNGLRRSIVYSRLNPHQRASLGIGAVTSPY